MGRFVIIVLFCLIGVIENVFSTPNIIVIMADDLGWNDVGFNGMNQIPTPNIDALAASGIKFQNHYVQPLCTPSRAAFMTGKYPIHNGMQHTVVLAMEARGLPLTEKLLPQYLKELGYKTHLVGKWHLGSYKKDYLPLSRGFDSHLGFWTGKIDMFDHTNIQKGTWGRDFRRDFEVADDLFGEYVTDIYTDEAAKIIQEHDTESPLFLMISHSAVHAGNSNDPIRAPEADIEKFGYIEDYSRQKFAGVLSKLDESVGTVISELEKKGILNNSVILFTSDNGGTPSPFEDNAGSNYPLKGTKMTLWEGGVRSATALWSPLLNVTSRIATQRMHIVDWLPTFLHIAGGNVSSLTDIDGIDQWNALSDDVTSERSSILLNIDDIFGNSAIIVDDWKLLKGTVQNGTWDDWFGPSGRDESYDIEALLNSTVASVFNKLNLMPTYETILQNRDEAAINCYSSVSVTCSPLEKPCLFNIANDPCELQNLADEYPDVVNMLLEELGKLNATAVAPGNLPSDPRGDPVTTNRIYTTFGDL